eukprot:CAMPEP_0184726306 /NCGR_PEP_ID=MMETSP0314-20130426/33378_1 /TAXON_ID=38298 /ORGANISM="Rhodella maculata, Strain CCMP 736" /LENGTH=87 /DNA_ID=CAMNT_0027191701 /DNA_START=82 /DNA_END=341 /DNA_ORIENTATION=-
MFSIKFDSAVRAGDREHGELGYGTSGLQPRRCPSTSVPNRMGAVICIRMQPTHSVAQLSSPPPKASLFPHTNPGNRSISSTSSTVFP